MSIATLWRGFSTGSSCIGAEGAGIDAFMEQQGGQLMHPLTNIFPLPHPVEMTMNFFKCLFHSHMPSRQGHQC